MHEMKTVGIISIGEMGMGFAQLLIAHKYRVVTYADDRSQTTRDNAKAAGVELLPSIEAVASESEAVLSIVPPRDAYTTAARFVDALSASARQSTLYYIDLNATSPETAKRTDKLFKATRNITLIDGGIIGGVPHPLATKTDNINGQSNGHTGDANGPVQDEAAWHCPACIVSGPDRLPDSTLASVLNIDHVSDDIGAATGIKMCFAATTKGFISLAIQSYTTAHQLGVLDNLRGYLKKYQSSTHALAEKGLVTMPPKAYRWVGEMKEIGNTFQTEGHFDSNLFYGVADVYSAVAEDTPLGAEKPGKRQRGKTVEDVVELMAEGLQNKKRKTEV